MIKNISVHVAHRVMCLLDSCNCEELNTNHQKYRLMLVQKNFSQHTGGSVFKLTSFHSADFLSRFQFARPQG